MHRCAAQILHSMISYLLRHISLQTDVNHFLNQWKVSLLFVNLKSEAIAIVLKMVDIVMMSLITCSELANKKKS